MSPIYRIANYEPSEHGQVIYQIFHRGISWGQKFCNVFCRMWSNRCTHREGGLTQKCKAQSSTLGGVQYLSTCQGTELQVQITKVFSQDIIAEITSCFDCGLPAEQNLVIICTRQSEHCAELQPLMVKHNPPQLFAHQSGRSGQRSSWGQKGRVWSGRGPP